MHGRTVVTSRKSPVTVQGTAPYLGDNEVVILNVRWGQTTHLECEFDGIAEFTVRATIRGDEDLHGMMIDTLVLMRAAYQDKLGMQPSPTLEFAWETAATSAWSKVLP